MFAHKARHPCHNKGFDFAPAMAEQLVRDLLQGVEVFEAGEDVAKEYRRMAVVIHQTNASWMVPQAHFRC